MKIKNPNFVSPRMNKHDIQGAFKIPLKGVHDLLYKELIPEGWVKKFNERYYKPTEKLLNHVFLPDNEKLLLSDEQVRFLAYNTNFVRKDLIALFDDNEQIVKRLLRIGFLMLERTGTFRKSVVFEELLSDGENKYSIAIKS